MLKDGCAFGRFMIERFVGSGATGMVYRAHSLDGKRTVAVKVLAPHLAKDPGVVTMFAEEAKVGFQLNHANIVKTIEIGCTEGLHFIVFEFVDGMPLSTLLLKGPLEEGQCIWILRQLGQALRQLRQKSIVHQDIKPDNILIEGRGNAMLTDLGFARAPKGRMQWDGFAVGTPVYMSPEQARGLKTVDGRADLYSLGATIYHAATGRPPFESKDETELLMMHVKDRAEPARTRNPKLNADFSAILARMLEKDPQWRFQHPEELLLAIRMLEVTPVPPFVAGSAQPPSQQQDKR